MAANTQVASVDHVLAAFKAQLPLRLKLAEVRKQIGTRTAGRHLDVGAENPVLSALLRKIGGAWTSVALTPGEAALASDVLEEKVAAVENNSLPFGNAEFDTVVVLSGLRPGGEDSAVIAECHRVLKQDGFIIVTVPHAKRWSVLRPIERLFGPAQPLLSGDTRESAYSDRELFKLMKDGFDVHAVRMYSRFFVELVRLFASRSDARMTAHFGDDYSIERLQRHRRAMRWYRVLFWFAFQLDFLCILTRGHRMVAKGKRRAWMPRRTPVMVDGRSISEAVLTRPAR